MEPRASLVLGKPREPSPWTGIYLKIVLQSRLEQRCSRAGIVGHHGHQEEGGVIGEDIIKQSEPLLSGQHF